MTLKKITKVMVGHEKDAHLEKEKKLTIKTHSKYVENPREGIKNHDFSKNTTFLPGLASIMYQKEISLQWSCLFLPTNSLLSSQNI